MPCEITIKPHTMDKCIELGISDKELDEMINRAPRKRRIRLTATKTKDFYTYRWYEIVAINVPCHRYIETVYD